MKSKSFDWITPDGLRIFAKEWPTNRPKALISIVHGMGEHIERYKHVAAFYHEAGIAVMGNDHRGHGQSDGKRGHTPGLAHLLDEVHTLVQKGKERYPEVPHFLFGQSLGGNLALNYALRRQPDLAGIVASSPWIQLGFKPNTFKVALGKFAKRLLPELTQSTDLNADHLSTDPKVGKVYVADPLVHDRITATMGMEIMDAADYLHNFQGSFPLPLLMMYGTEDKIVSPAAVQQFSERVSGDIECIPWKGLYHELHNEYLKEEVLNTTLNWITKKITTQ